MKEEIMAKSDILAKKIKAHRKLVTVEYNYKLVINISSFLNDINTSTVKTLQSVFFFFSLITGLR